MQACPSEGWRQVIEDHRLAAALGLGTLAGIVDDEGIKVWQRPQGPLRKTAGGQPQSLARQPFQVAVLAHMHHRMGAKLLAQPEVLGQVGVGGRQVGAVIAEGRIPVVAAVRLDQHAHVAELQTTDREAGCSSGGANQSDIEFRRSPHRL